MPLQLHMDVRTKGKASFAQGAVLPSDALGVSLPHGLWARAEIKAHHLLLHQHRASLARMGGQGWGASWDSLLVLLSPLHSLPAPPGASTQLPQQGLRTQTPF